MDKEEANVLLFSAAKSGVAADAQKALDAGANVNAKDNYDQTPLHRAAAYGRFNIVKLLIANSADVTARDSDGKTPRHWAAEFGNDRIVGLLENGADFGTVADAHAAFDVAATKPQRHADRVAKGRTDKGPRQPGG